MEGNQIFETIKMESLDIDENEAVPSMTKINQCSRDRDVSRRREGKSQFNKKHTDADTIKILRRKVMRLQAENRRLRDSIRTSRYINRMSQKAQSVFQAFNLLDKKAGPDLSMFDSTSFAAKDRDLLVPPSTTLMEEPHVILSTSMETVGENITNQKSLAVRKDIFEDKPINPFENLPYRVQSIMDAQKPQYVQNPPEFILDYPPYSMRGQPIVAENGRIVKCVDLNGIPVAKESLEKCNTTKASKLTIDLMSILFTLDEMADSSLTGKPSNIHKSRSPDQIRPKQPLNPLRTKALFAYVKEKFPGTNDQIIKNALKCKLKYEAQKKYGVGFTKPTRIHGNDQRIVDRSGADTSLLSSQ